MKRARAFGFWGLSVVCAASFVYACSSSSSDATGGGTNGKDATAGDDGSSITGDDGSTSNNDSGGSTKDSGGGDSAAGPCGSSATYDDCFTCCDGLSDGGVSEYYQLQFTCLCNSKKCGTVSKCKNTFCVDPTQDAGTSCNNCIDQKLADDAGDAGCQDPVINECAADMGCAQGIECMINSACADKP